MSPKTTRSQRFEDFFTAINTSNWQITLPVHIPEARSLKWELPRIGHYREYLPGSPRFLQTFIDESFQAFHDVKIGTGMKWSSDFLREVAAIKTK